METAGPWEIAFWYLSILLRAGLLGRIVWLKRVSEYPAMSTLFALQLTRSLWLAQYSTKSATYSVSYVLTEPLLVVAQALVVFELYRRILTSYGGLSFFTRGTMAVVLAGSVALSAATHLPEFTPQGDLSVALKAAHLFETVVYTALLFFLVAIAAFMLWFPMPVRKNVLVHCFGFAAYFVISSATLFIRQLDIQQWGRLTSLWRIVASDVVMAAWILLLSRRGEEESRNVSFHFTPASQERLLGQLDTLNRILESKRK